FESGSFTKSGACSRNQYFLHVSDLSSLLARPSMLIDRFKQLHSLESPAPPDTPMLPMICPSTSLRGIPPANVTRWPLVSSMPFAPLGSTKRLGDHNIKGHWRFSVE